MGNYLKINREDFMKFFRDTEKLNELTADDRVEIFKTILSGSSDLTKAILEDTLDDYSVSNFKIIDTSNDEE